MPSHFMYTFKDRHVHVLSELIGRTRCAVFLIDFDTFRTLESVYILYENKMSATSSSRAVCSL